MTVKEMISMLEKSNTWANLILRFGMPGKEKRMKSYAPPSADTLWRELLFFVRNFEPPPLRRRGRRKVISAIGFPASFSHLPAFAETQTRRLLLFSQELDSFLNWRYAYGKNR